MNLKREVIIGIALVVIVILGALWYFGGQPTSFESQPSTASSPASAPVTAAAPTPVSLNQSGQYYDVTASYPSATSLQTSASGQADVAAVALMKQFEQQTIAQFKVDGGLNDMTAANAAYEGITADNKESLTISYTNHAGPHTITYVYTISEDTLGAHPNTTYQTFTFDTTTGTQLALSNLFSANADYLDTLSTATRAALPALIATREGVGTGDIATDSLNSGTTPTSDNFSDWYIDGSDLVIIFPPYQVAAYAAGEIEVRLPLSSLAGANASYQ